jgi:hypothetical protein
VAWDEHASVIFTSAIDQAHQIVEIIDIRVPPASPSLTEAGGLAMQLLPQDATFVGRTSQEIRSKIVLTDRFDSVMLRNFFTTVCVARLGFMTRPGEVRVAYTTEPSDGSLLAVSVNWSCPQR